MPFGSELHSEDGELGGSFKQCYTFMITLTLVFDAE